MKKKSNTLPKDWHGPMKEAAALLRRYGAKKVRYNHPIVKSMMLWGITNLIFFKLNHDKKDRRFRKRS